MDEELLINVSDFETRVALLRDGAAEELHLARADSYSLTGNIYLGRVVRIMPGMQAAFVDVGLERPGFLHASDIQNSRLETLVASSGKKTTGAHLASSTSASSTSASETPASNAPKHQDIRTLLQYGQEVLVQIVKDPISSKGARLTTQLAIASRYLVYMPFTNHIGISQRIEDGAERDRLRDLIQQACISLDVKAGFIARTAADAVSDDVIRTDLRVLSRIWRRVSEKRTDAGCPDCVYQEIPLHVRVVRDLVGPAVSKILIDHQPTYARVQRFVREFLPEALERVQLYANPKPLFEFYGVDAEVQSALHKRVDLKCGGYLIIEQTEAMVTIDVNTGGYLGNSNLEETVFRANVEAAAAIPRQLRLRNLGGIIVVDFIDMVDEEHQRQVLQTLELASASDPARMRMEGFSSLGLVQMSRKRTRESLQQQLCEPCTNCDGVGMVRTAQTTCIEIFRAITEDVASRCKTGSPSLSDATEYLIRAPERVVDRLLDEDAEQLAQLGRLIEREIRIQVEPSYGPGQYDLVLMQGVGR